MGRRAALFDMDRTLVRRETASLYVRYQRERGHAGWRDSAQVAYWVAQYTLGIIDAPNVAVRALRQVRGMPETVLSARCDDWFRKMIERHVADKGRMAVDAHRRQGDLLAIVTGASLYTARPLARLLEISHVVATELELDSKGHFTGRPVFPLCIGEGKVERALRFAQSEGFRLDDATFYSDSFTDLPLLERVREPIVINPDTRLARVARRRGWPIESW